MNHLASELQMREGKCIQEDIGLISRGHMTLELNIKELGKANVSTNHEEIQNILYHTQQNEKERI